MSMSRTLRRAAERQAQKQARKEAQLAAAPAVSEPEPAPVSEARLEANRANADERTGRLLPVVRDSKESGTGPCTEAGKAKSSKNALKTGLTGQTALLPGDDADAYSARLADYQKMYKPVGTREIEIVQALCDAWWRLTRIPSLISALYLKGANEFKDRVQDLDPSTRSAALELETYTAYERQFLNLQLQERRLYNYTQKLKTELAELQKERDEREAEAYSHASMLYLAAKKDRRPFDPADFGFEFSVGAIEDYLYASRARGIAEEAAGKGEIHPQRIRHAS